MVFTRRRKDAKELVLASCVPGAIESRIHLEQQPRVATRIFNHDAHGAASGRTQQKNRDHHEGREGHEEKKSLKENFPCQVVRRRSGSGCEVDARGGLDWEPQRAQRTQRNLVMTTGLSGHLRREGRAHHSPRHRLGKIFDRNRI